MAKTQFHANQILADLKAGGVWLGFLSDSPVSNTEYEEVDVSGYSRAAVTFNDPANGMMDSSADITVPGDLMGVRIRFVGLFDAVSGGNLLRYYAVPGDEWTVNTTDNLAIGAGNLIVKE